MRRLSFFVVFVFSVGLVLSGCGGGGEQTTPTTDQSTQTASAAGSGDLTVTVNFDGEQPAREEFDASGNPECKTDAILGEKVLVNDNGTLRNVVVAVTEGPSGLEAESPESVTIDQKKCEYIPHVAAVKAEQKFTIKDSDEGLHNVRATKEGRQLFNYSTFKGQTKTASFDEPGVYSLECNVHPWMQGWVYVTEHGRASVTGDQGDASLKDLPAGEYTIVTWHEEYGTKEQTVNVEKDATASLSFSYSS